MADRAPAAGLRADLKGEVGPLSIVADFELAGGQILAVTGPSGSGKTSLLRLIAGLLEPTSGSLALGGCEWFNRDAQINVPAEQRGVGMVFQEYALFPRMTAARNVEFAISGKRRPERRSRAVAILSELGLADRADRLPGTLSGGERQRLALARAIARDPKLLLLDEPLAALDDAAAAEALGLIERTVNLLEVPCLLVTHSRQATAVADRALVVDRGRPVVEMAASEALRDRPS